MDTNAWDARYAEHELVWSAEPNEFVVAEAGGPPHRGATAVDLACGEGRNAVWLAEHGWEVTGVDFSPVALDKARGLAQRRGVTVDWVVADVTTWQPPDTVVLVVIAYLQLPPSELEAALAGAVAAVGVGGRLIAVGHHVDNLEHGHGGPPDRRVLWDHEWISQRLVGLTVWRALRVPRVVETEQGSRTALDALVLASRA